MGVYAGVTTTYLTQSDTSKIAPSVLKYRLWAKSKGATSLGRPTVDFNFADNKSLVDEVSGNNLIDFARSTTATYVDFDGLIKTAAVNTPRFDHDPLTGECKGLLIEEDRINLVFTSVPSGWSDFNRTTETTGITAPDGSTDAKNYDNTGGTVNDFIFVNVNTTLSNGDSYVISVFSNKSGTDITQGGLASGKYTALGSTQHIQYQNGWYRHWRAYEATQDNPNITPQIVIFTSGTFSNQTLWGLQVEPVPDTYVIFPTSYIPTSGAQVTRTPDLTEIDGTNFTSWYNSSESTIYSEFNGYVPTGATGAYFGSNTNGWGFYSNTTNIRNKGRTNHNPDRGLFSVSDGQMPEFRGAISQSDVDGETSYAVNGSMITTDATRSGPYGLTGNNIGMSVSAADTGSANQTRGSFVVRRTTYWNRRVTNAVLESLTE